MIKSYKKKPLIVEGVQYTGKLENELIKFCPVLMISSDGYDLYIETLEGNMKVNKGDYIVKGINGEFYPIKEEIFKKSFEEL